MIIRKLFYPAVFCLCALFLISSNVSRATEVGAGKTYTTLKAAFDAINAGTLTGAVLLEITSNLIETKTAILKASGVGQANYSSVLIRPKGNARSISGSFSPGTSTPLSLDTMASIIYLNGATNVTIDGRVDGIGSSVGLTVANTSSPKANIFAIRLNNDASSNKIRYCTINAPNTTSNQGATGMIIFTTPTLTGNNNNTVEHCVFDSEFNGGLIGITLYSLLDTGTTIANNEFKNIPLVSIYAYNSGSGLKIEQNSIYWTSNVPVNSTNLHLGIFIVNIKKTTVTGNYIGGSAPFCGGQAATLSMAPAASFLGIVLNGNCSENLDIDGNVISNLDITAGRGSANGGAVSGIVVLSSTNTAGVINIGSTLGNTIGSATGVKKIIVRTSNATTSSNLTVNGVRVQSSVAQVNIHKNTISGFFIPVPENNSGVYTSFYGVAVLTNKATITNNTIGSASTPNSIENQSGGTQSTTTFGSYGIYYNTNTSGNAIVISDNKINHLVMNSASTKAVAIGIHASGPAAANITASGNTVSDISTIAANTGSDHTGSLIGMYVNNVAKVSDNKIANLYQQETNAPVYIQGLLAAGGNTVIEKNFIHHLSAVNQSSTIIGIKSGNTLSILKNNKVHLGLHPDGSPITVGAKINGLHFLNPHHVYNNSIYIGGSQVVGNAPTTAIYSLIASPANTYKNNILVNNRSNQSGSSNNLIYTSDAELDQTQQIDYNLYENKGAGFFFARTGNANFATFSTWRALTGQDANSGETDPMFMNALGSSATIDLHLQASNPATSRGTYLAEVTEDFDGNTLNSATTDIGADAGVFVQTHPDMQPPTVSFTDIPDQRVANEITLSNFAAATDDVGIATGLVLPRLYFKKATNANAFAGNAANDNGWKYVLAKNAGSPFGFTMDFSLLHGDPVTMGDTIQYFVVAQDLVGHLASYPAGIGAVHYPPVENINFADISTVKSFAFTSALPVKFISFTAQHNNNSHQLQWITTAEINNSHFELERSSDGSHFTVIGKIEAAVKPTLQQHYRFDDNNPLPGTNYYRLKQVDLDGAFALSDITLLTAKLDIALLVSPNPTTHHIKLQPVQPFNKTAITLYTINGQKVIQKSGISGKEYVLDLSGVPKGLYLLEVKTQERVIVRKVVKD